MLEPPRCAASYNGWRCEKPAGHSGPHILSWRAISDVREPEKGWEE